jgi:hypothetical protein
VREKASSQEGGTESPYHHIRDAMQLALHEVGARPATDKHIGIHVVTSAGREYFNTLQPFKLYQPSEGQSQEEVKAAVVAAYEARRREIHEQLKRYPQVPFVVGRVE